MGYVCPVCGDLQADGRHLANHLAFTALLGDDDHEAWLDEQVSDWGEMGPDDLAPLVTERAEERDASGESGEMGGTGGTGSDPTGHTHEGSGHRHGDGSDSAVHEGGYDPEADADSGAAPDAFDGAEPDGPTGSRGPHDADADVEDVLAEARELTRRRRRNAGAGSERNDSGDADGDGEPEAGGGADGDGESDAGESGRAGERSG
ncbi:MAG: DUF5810 domain-containing protein [Haloarculaceae archaeon]